MKIGIFGGTFDPVHRGHLQLAQNARTQFSLDKVIFVPAFQPPHKQEIAFLTPAKDRYEMVRLAIQGTPFLELSDCELRRKGVSYTFDTLFEFEKTYPAAQFFLILGEDVFEGIDRWYRAAELKEKVRFLVARRETDEAPLAGGIRAQWLRMPLCPISASGIRAAIQQGRDVDDYLSPEVLRYIRSQKLYRKD